MFTKLNFSMAVIPNRAQLSVIAMHMICEPGPDLYFLILKKTMKAIMFKIIPVGIKRMLP